MWIRNDLIFEIMIVLKRKILYFLMLLSEDTINKNGE